MLIWYYSKFWHYACSWVSLSNVLVLQPYFSKSCWTVFISCIFYEGKKKKKKSKTHNSWNYTEMKGYTLKTVKTKPNNSKNKSQKIHIPLSELFCPNLIITGQWINYRCQLCKITSDRNVAFIFTLFSI